MKKVFALKAPGKVDQRVVESVKNDVRKYVQRERRKTLPEGFTVWTFQCKAGATRDDATPCPLPNLGGIIDAVAAAGGSEVYVEILAEPGHRTAQTESE
jgi:hypothetical protein